MNPIADFVTGALKPVLDKFVPDAKDRLEAELLVVKQINSVDLAQIEVNKVEASSDKLFVSGWRPFVGWVCGGTFAYAVVGHDILNWLLNILGVFYRVQVPTLPVPDTSLTYEILMALLGFGGLRSWEKWKGVANK